MYKSIKEPSLLTEVKNSKILKKYGNFHELYDYGVITYKTLHNTAKWYMKNIGAGATFRRNICLVELENGKKVWWAEIADNEWEEKVADWIFDENGKTLLCYPDPREFDRILIELDRKHGYDEFHRPIKKEKTKQKIVSTQI